MIDEMTEDVGKSLLKDIKLDQFSAACRAELEKAKLSEYYPDEYVREVYNNPRFQSYHVKTLIGRVKSYASAKRRQAELEKLPCIFLGGRDFFLSYMTGWQQIKSQRIHVITDDGELREISTWGNDIGDRGLEVPVKGLHGRKLVVNGEWEEWTSQRTGREGRTWQARYVEDVSQQPTSTKEIVSHLLPLAIAPDQVTEEMANKYKDVVIRGQIRTFDAEAQWMSTGNQVMVKNDDGTPARDEKGDIIYREERVREGDRPFVTTRFGDPSETAFEFNVLLNAPQDSPNRVRVQFRNQRLGYPLLRLLDGQVVFEDAARMSGESRDEDPFHYLSSIYQGTEVLIVGTVTQWNVSGNANWINVQGSAILQIEGAEEAVSVEAPELPPEPVVTERPDTVYQGIRVKKEEASEEDIKISIGEPEPVTDVATDEQPAQVEVTAPEPEPEKPAPKEVPAPTEITERLVQLNAIVQDRIKTFSGMNARELYNAGVFEELKWFSIDQYEAIVNEMIEGKWETPAAAKPKEEPVTPTTPDDLTKIRRSILMHLKSKPIHEQGGAKFSDLLEWSKLPEDKLESILIDLLTEGLIYEPEIHRYMAVK